MRVRRVELHATDAVSRGADTRFTFNPTTVFEFCPEPHVGSGRRINHALDSENFRRQTYSLHEVSGYTGQRCQEQIAEAVIVKSAVAVESEPEEARHQMFVLGEGDHAVADIARRQNAEFLAKTSGASSVVSDGNDDGEVRLRPRGEVDRLGGVRGHRDDEVLPDPLGDERGQRGHQLGSQCRVRAD